MKKHNPWIMVLCCGLPLLLFGVAVLIGVPDTYKTWIIFLLCPLMMIGMMLSNKGCGMGNKDQCKSGEKKGEGESNE